MEQADIVIHLACDVGSYHYYKDNPFTVFMNNLAIDQNVMGLAIASKVRKLIYASSSHVYWPSSMPSKEFMSPFKDPVLSYGYEKRVGEKMLEYASEEGCETQTIALRLNGIYGPGQDIDIEKGSLIPVLCHKAAEYPEYGFKLKTDGREFRSYCYIDDCVEAFELCLAQDWIGYKGAFNVASDQAFSVRRIAEQIMLISGKNIILELGKSHSEIGYQSVDNIKILEGLGWFPETKLEDGLRKTYEDIEKRL
jgi:nucleoside-diphosphate-sugar epimerase